MTVHRSFSIQEMGPRSSTLIGQNHRVPFSAVGLYRNEMPAHNIRFDATVRYVSFTILDLLARRRAADCLYSTQDNTPVTTILAYTYVNRGYYSVKGAFGGPIARSESNSTLWPPVMPQIHYHRVWCFVGWWWYCLWV